MTTFLSCLLWAWWRGPDVTNRLVWVMRKRGNSIVMSAKVMNITGGEYPIKKGGAPVCRRQPDQDSDPGQNKTFSNRRSHLFLYSNYFVLAGKCPQLPAPNIIVIFIFIVRLNFGLGKRKRRFSEVLLHLQLEDIPNIPVVTIARYGADQSGFYGLDQSGFCCQCAQKISPHGEKTDLKDSVLWLWDWPNPQGLEAL